MFPVAYQKCADIMSNTSRCVSKAIYILGYNILIVDVFNVIRQYAQHQNIVMKKNKHCQTNQFAQSCGNIDCAPFYQSVIAFVLTPLYQSCDSNNQSCQCIQI